MRTSDQQAADLRTAVNTNDSWTILTECLRTAAEPNRPPEWHRWRHTARSHAARLLDRAGL